MVLQLAHQHPGAVAARLQLQVVGDGAQDLVARQRRVGEVDGFDVPWQPLHQHTAQHGLAAANLARHLDDALVVLDGVEQPFERRAPIGAVEEEIGMRRDAERRFVEAEVIEVHRYLPALGGGVAGEPP